MSSRVGVRAGHEVILRAELKLLLASAALFLLCIAYFKFGLGLEIVRIDAASYWADSQSWTSLFGTWWVPGYAITLAIARSLTFGQLPPAAVMLLVSGTFYLLSVKVVYNLACEYRLDHAFEVALFFAVYPFIGVTYCVYPIADGMAIALLLLSILAFERRRWLPFAAYAGLAMLTHKATWFFVPPLMVAAFLKSKESRPLLPLALAPLGLLAATGAVYHHDLFWMLRWSTSKLLVSRSSLPLLDGVISPMVSGSPAKVVKGALVLFILLVAAAVAIASFRRRFVIGLSISASVVLMAVIINQYEAWAIIRFSKPLVIPAACLMLVKPGRLRAAYARAFPALFLLGAISNVGYGYYMAKLFRGGRGEQVKARITLGGTPGKGVSGSGVVSRPRGS